MKILVCGGNPAMISHFRGPLLRELLARGHEVVAVGGWRNEGTETQLADMGVRYLTWPIVPTGLNPVKDVRAVRRLTDIISTEKPDVFFGYALKPGLYGAMAAAAAKTPRRVILIEGLGYAFGPGGELKRKVARAFAEVVFAVGLRAADHLVVLNSDDEAFFHARRPNLSITRLPGIGVDLERFCATPMPDGPMTFVMISRLLKDKGVGVFVEAARRVRETHPETNFILVGPSDPSPNGFSEAEVQAWQDQGWVDYVGAQKDVRPFLARSHVLVLPSLYREGFPTTVMEASASGRAVITTNMPGCRDSIIAGETGILIPHSEPEALSASIRELIEQPAAVRRLGAAGRRLAEQLFSSQRHAERLADIILSSHAD